jgi:hypothetical protein
MKCRSQKYLGFQTRSRACQVPVTDVKEGGLAPFCSRHYCLMLRPWFQYEVNNNRYLLTLQRLSDWLLKPCKAVSKLLVYSTLLTLTRSIVFLSFYFHCVYPSSIYC